MEAEEISLLSDPAILAMLVVGLGLVLTRPYWAFLFAVFVSISLDQRLIYQSRLSGLGEYFNVNDLCVLLCLLGAAADCMSRRRALRLPLVPLVLVGVLLF